MGYLLLVGCLVALIGSHGMQGEGSDDGISSGRIVKRSRYTKVQRLSVIAFEAEPYVMVKTSPTGETLYEGFAIDLLDAVCVRVSCLYTIYLSHEGIGDRSSGVIGEVSRGAADLGLGPIPITSMRSNVVQFSTPWLDIPLSVVIRRGAGITSLGELLNQDKIRYGMSISGVAMRKFIVTREEPYSRMAATMSANPNVYVSEVKHGISRVLTENYSLIVDRPMAMYQANKHCELEAFGAFLNDGQGFGFAMTKGDRLMPGINKALSDMKRDGTIRALYEKWWNKNGCAEVSQSVSGGTTSLPLALRTLAVALAACVILRPL